MGAVKLTGPADKALDARGIHMHHKFVVCDFNGSKPVVFTGSSNMAAGGEQGNGDNLIEIRDPKVVIAYCVQAVSIFDQTASAIA
jgi:phosphatidylserine/phosphatidylglycerophosphate/cardiolipin synthase-like enzyme